LSFDFEIVGIDHLKNLVNLCCHFDEEIQIEGLRGFGFVAIALGIQVVVSLVVIVVVVVVVVVVIVVVVVMVTLPSL
jgi:hypothetical protein